MSTVQEVFRRGVSLLRPLSQSHLEAKVLLLKASSLTEAEAFSSPERPLPRRAERSFYKLISKRLNGFPLSYLTGEREFWSIPFKVFPGVFIPRPETELIVEKVLELSSGKDETVVDIGTGCGNIAVSLAKELPRARIIASDVSQRALKAARLNAAGQGVNHIAFVRSNLYSNMKKFDLEERCDFIVSNPPYVAAGEWAGLSGEIRNHEPRRALVAGGTGVEFIVRLIPESLPFLKPGGYLLFEIGEGQEEKIFPFFGHHWASARLENDLNGIPRVFVGQKGQS